jgi:magnesium-transporting ATPase (P-type)
MFGWFKGTASQRVLRIIVILTVVVYLAFFLIGYNHPYADDPDFIEPRLTSVLIFFALLVVVLAVAVTAWAMLSDFRKRASLAKADRRLPTSRLVAIIVALIIAMMLVSYWVGSTAAITVNGKDYADTTKLRLADMFVFTSLALMAIAAVAAAVSTIRSQFRKKR